MTQSLDQPNIRATQEEDVVVEVATICKGSDRKQLANLRRLVASMLDQSAGSKIRLTILSDPDSWPPAHAVLRKTIGHYYAKGENCKKCRSIFQVQDNTAADTHNFYPILTSIRSLFTMIDVYCLI